MRNDKLIWALGGESHAAPEDTIPAYWGAIGAGADGLVIGVQLTADNELVCCSNLSLDKTCGDSRAVGKLELSDCLLYTSPSPRDLSTSRMPSSA